MNDLNLFLLFCSFQIILMKDDSQFELHVYFLAIWQAYGAILKL